MGRRGLYTGLIGNQAQVGEIGESSSLDEMGVAGNLEWRVNGKILQR